MLKLTLQKSDLGGRGRLGGLCGNSLKGLESGAVTPEGVHGGSLGCLRGQVLLMVGMCEGWDAPLQLLPLCTLSGGRHSLQSCDLLPHLRPQKQSRMATAAALLGSRSGLKPSMIPSRALGVCEILHQC